MKRFYKIITGACIALFLIACADDSENTQAPLASVIVNTKALEVNRSMEVRFTGFADQVVIYTGDAGHAYARRDLGDTGFIVNKNLFTYSYAVPGTFRVVCVASSYDKFMGKGLRRDTTAFDVMVKDDVTTISRIYSTIRPNVYFAELIDNETWVMRFPKKQIYNNRELPVNTARTRLSFDIASDSSKIYIDNELYSSKNYYDLTRNHQLRVVSHAGTIRHYNLCPIIYPEFSLIKLAGVQGSLQRNAFDQSLQNYHFVLPVATDLTHVIVEYAADTDSKFYCDEHEVASGSAVDLSDENKRYTLVCISVQNNKVTAVSKIQLKVQSN